MKRRGETAGQGLTEAVTEFHIVGGLHPDLPFEYFMDLVRGLKERYPKVHIKAFTMVEIAFLAKVGKISIAETIERMKEAVWAHARVAVPRSSPTVCATLFATTRSMAASGWRRLGCCTRPVCDPNATMLYGHIENDEDRVDHLLKLREVQDGTGGFQTFIPLSFHPDNTALGHLPKSSGMTDIRQIAVSRLLLDNFAHIKSYWQMVTPKMAQISLRFGADDIDGTVVEEKIYHDAGANTPQGLRRQDLVRLITEAGRVPFERDTLYRAVTRTEDSFTVAV